MQTFFYETMSNLHIETTQKFKDTTISFRFLTELSAKSATVYALLALCMEDRNEKAPSKVAMNQQMDELYGAKLDVRSIGYGKALAVEVRSKVVDDRYLDASIAQDHFEWLLTMIQSPLLNEETFNEAKVVLKQTLLRNQDSATKYAINQAFQIAGEGYPLEVDTSGSLDELEAIVLSDLKLAHHHLLTEARLDVFLITSASLKLYQSLFAESFLNVERKSTVTMYKLEDTKERRVVKRKDLKQTNLVLVYNAKINPIDSLYWPLRVGLVALGQLPSSLCFTEIREKRSLCYFIGANMVTFDGAVYVYTGIDQTKKDEVIELISEQMQRLINQDVSDQLIDNSQTMMVNSMLGMVDDPFAMINFMYQRLLMDSPLTIDEIMDQIRAVTKESIAQAIQQCTLRTVFSLQPKEEVQ